MLCSRVPDFLKDYIQLPLVQRLSGIGLLCGTDWTKLFRNRFFYSRLDHSIGTALIAWNFSRSKKQAIAALLHDVSTPAFSHVSDFRNGDALLQESTEDLNIQMINENAFLKELLERDGYNLQEVNDYHKYPIDDNKCPGLSADRLEYMFPSGAALNEVWTMEEIKETYKDVAVLRNEKLLPELGFKTESIALDYLKKFTDVSLILQHNEDKAAMQLMADVMTVALKENIIHELDLYLQSESELIEFFDDYAVKNPSVEFTRLYLTFRNMDRVIHSEERMDDCWCVSLDVKKRYVDPLVQVEMNRFERISKINEEADKVIKDFLSYKDSLWGCVPYYK
ncbi:MAG: hypothetical protein K6D58_03940 [Treponema sp.]|nr:hypothetical protein [Treponema sp.]